VLKPRELAMETSIDSMAQTNNSVKSTASMSAISENLGSVTNLKDTII